MIVKNLNRTTQKARGGGSWLAHWEKISGQNAFMCFVTGCIKRPSAGGVVQKDSPTDKGWYVVPLCDDCNKARGQDLDIWDAAKLVSVNGLGILGMAPHASPYRAPRFAGSL